MKFLLPLFLGCCLWGAVAQAGASTEIKIISNQKNYTGLKAICIDVGPECALLNKLAHEYNLKTNSSESKNLDNQKIIFIPKPLQWVTDNLPLELQAGKEYDLVVTSNPLTLKNWYLDISPFVNPSFFDIYYSDTKNWIGGRNEDEKTALAGFTMGISFPRLYIRQDDLKLDLTTDISWRSVLEKSKQVAFEKQIPNNILIGPDGALWAAMAAGYDVYFADSHGDYHFSGYKFKQFIDIIQSWKRDGLFSITNWDLTSKSKDFEQLFINEEAEGFYDSGFYYKKFTDQHFPFSWAAIPNLCGVYNCSFLPEQHSLIALHTTRYPLQVAKFLEWLALPDQQIRYAQATLSLPGYQPLQKSPRLYEGLSANEADYMKNIKQQYIQLSPDAQALLSSSHKLALYHTLLRQIRISIASIPIDEIIEHIKNEFERRRMLN